MHPCSDLLVTQSPLSTNCGIGVRERGRTISVREVTTPQPLYTGPLTDPLHTVQHEAYALQSCRL